MRSGAINLLSAAGLFLLAVMASDPVAADTSISASQDRGHLEYALRGAMAPSYGAPRIASGPARESVFGGQALSRVKHGAFSLLVPGWSQWRSGHDKRAVFFATAEVAVWGTWIFSKVQANHREDQYVDFAQQFAQVSNGDQPDDYWRALASYRDSDDFNSDIRADIRAGIEPESSLIGASDAWRWQSEQRFREFQQLRGAALNAQDRADFVIVFALVNRVVAFIDAVRTGPPTGGNGDLSSARPQPKTWDLDVRPSPSDPSASLTYHLRF